MPVDSATNTSSCSFTRRSFLKTLGVTALAAPFVTRDLIARPPSSVLRPASFGAAGMAWEDLTDGNYYMKVKIWNMGSAAAAKELYTGLLSDSYFSQDNNSWVTCTATACPTP